MALLCGNGAIKSGRNGVRAMVFWTRTFGRDEWDARRSHAKPLGRRWSDANIWTQTFRRRRLDADVWERTVGRLDCRTHVCYNAHTTLDFTDHKRPFHAQWGARKILRSSWRSHRRSHRSIGTSASSEDRNTGLLALVKCGTATLQSQDYFAVGWRSKRFGRIFGDTIRFRFIT